MEWKTMEIELHVVVADLEYILRHLQQLAFLLQ